MRYKVGVCKRFLMPVFLINKPLLKLPVLEKNWYGMTVHEIRHFMDVITQPSAIIKESISKTMVKLKKIN